MLPFAGSLVNADPRTAAAYVAGRCCALTDQLLNKLHAKFSVCLTKPVTALSLVSDICIKAKCTTAVLRLSVMQAHH